MAGRRALASLAAVALIGNMSLVPMTQVAFAQEQTVANSLNAKPGASTANAIHADAFSQKWFNAAARLDVPVEVTYADSSTDKTSAHFDLDANDDGIADAGRASRQPNPAPDSGAGTTADEIQPVYAGKLVSPQSRATVTPTFRGLDGSPVDAPSGLTFKIADGYQAPEGYQVSINDLTGEITVSVEGVDNPWYWNSWNKIEQVRNRNNGGTTVTGYGVVLNNSTSALNGGGNRALPDGTPVYLQWVDTDGQVSPIYRTRTYDNFPGAPSNGAYAFAIPQWTDESGTVHTLKISLSSNPLVRVWIEPLVDEVTGNTLVELRNAGSNVPSYVYARPSGANGLTMFSDSVTTLAGQYANNWTVMMTELPGEYLTRPESEWVATPPGTTGGVGSRNQVRGSVWHETGGSDLASGPVYNGIVGKDTPADSYTVVTSALTEKGGREAEKILDLEIGEQPRAFKRLLEAHPEYIAATVTAQTDSKGNYVTQFGPEVDLSKAYLYGFVKDPDGNLLPAYSAFTLPIFKYPTQGSNLVKPLAQPLWRPIQESYSNVHYALNRYVAPSLDITNYNSTDRPAPIGGLAKLSVKGIIGSGGSSIVWKKNGREEVKRCDGLTSLSMARACTFEIPDTAVAGDVFTAQLESGGKIISIDSLVVSTVPVPSYEPVEVPDDSKEASSQRPTFDDPTTKNVVEKDDAPASTTYRLDDGAPEGFEVDPATGVVSWRSLGSDRPTGIVEVPVIAEVPDAARQNKKVDQLASAVFDFAGLIADELEPAYEKQLVVPGTPSKVTPTFTDANGDAVDVPANTKFMIDPGF
ncbi:hypothetical protein NXS13_07840, partial [Corynebacterium sp. ES2730-CONJ]|uniref:Rib/alpha-like domain-containing protein n=1 Tax=Corynebacterium sp. ES2730-CONJ TaxID=2973941 RepID=UPI00286F8970